MKILQVTSTFYPAWAYGGIARIVYELSRGLAAKGHEVTVYTTDVYDRKRRLNIGKNNPVDIKGIKTYYFKNINNKLAYDYRFFLTPKIISVARKEISSFDVIHLQEYYAFQNVIIHHYAKKYNIPYVLNAHAAFCPAHRRHKSKAKKIFTHLFGKRILSDLSKAIALTPEEKNQFLMMGIDKDKIKIIPNGIHLSEFTNLPRKGAFKEKYSIPKNTKIVLFLGRLHKIKGLDLLVRSFYRLTKSISDIKLVIAGPDEGYLSTINRLVKKLGLEKKVLFTGGVYQKEKLSAYVDANVFVLSSYSEGFSITVLEACASGTPVVITDRCNIPEVADYKAGFVVKCDENEIEKALYEILSNDELRKKFSENGKRIVKEKFTWDKVIGQVEEVYKEVSRRG